MAHFSRTSGYSRSNETTERGNRVKFENSNPPRQWQAHCQLNTLPSPSSSFTKADSSEYTQIIRSSPVMVKVPVPMPRSISFRKLDSAAKFPSAFLPIVSMMPSPESKEQRSKKRRSQSMDDIFNSQMKTFGRFLNSNPVSKAMSDCVPSSSSSYGSSSGSHSTTGSSSSPSCEIPLVERLIRTHPVWFLPSLQRSGALHLLQGREVGNFIVRSSTLPVTMAVSVKLPGNTVEHYLLRAVDNRIALENSTHTFQTVHQLIAHYSTVSDEIPVCLRVPSAIAEATTTQQLRSLALLGQEFWTHSPSPKEILSPSDAELSKTFNSSGLGSQSSSSQTSLSEGRKPCRPTTLELGSSFVGGVISATVTPPPVPPRWSRSTLLTPLSLPSSIQSTPSEIQSTFSEKGGRLVKKKKRSSGIGKEPIHYKDTEILDIFRGTRTNYDDKASDYEDIWTPQKHFSLSQSQTPQELPRLSTFKPDLIASSYGSDLDTLYKTNSTKCQFQSLSSVSMNNNFEQRTHFTSTTKQLTAVFNTKNHRLSFNGQTYDHNNQSQDPVESESHDSDLCDPMIDSNGLKQEIKEQGPTNPRSILSKSKSSLYSEPVDSIVFRRNTHYRHSEPNIRWSQPAMMSLLNVELDTLPDIPQSPDHGLGEEEYMSGGVKLRHLRSSLVNVSTKCRQGEDHDEGKENKSTRNSSGVTCVSVDNLCHLRDLRDIRKRAKSKFNCGGGRQGSDDEEIVVENKQCVNARLSPVSATTGSGSITTTGTGSGSLSMTSTYKNGTNMANKNIVKPKPAPRKRSTDLNLKIENERRQEHEILEVSNNQSWHLDNSWEFVNWEKAEAERQMLASQKFPVSLPLVIGGTSSDESNNNCGGDELTQVEDQVNMNHPSLNLHRFSRYDNLDCRDSLAQGEGASEDGGGTEEMADLDREDKISAPWDSSKWENLLRMVSESTHELDSIIQVPENTPISTGFESISSARGNLYNSTGRDRDLRSRESKLITESRQRISKILEVSGNVDKAGKTIAAVVRDLAEKGTDFFGPTLKSFISCTIAAKSQDPYKVMQNTRQFISGMKNYLVGVSAESAELRNEIKRQRELLSECEFLNIDAILEEVLVDLVISPLNMHIRGLLQTHHDKISEPLKDLPVSNYNPFPFTPPTDTIKQESYDKLRKIIVGFEDFVSPIKKLDKWNEFVCEVQEMDNYSTESFLPLLSEVMSSVCARNMDSHVDYMIGLLPRSLADQNNYSISLLQSALAAIKYRKADRKGSSTLTSIRVIVPDERNGTLIRKMVPIRDTTTTKDVAKIVASKVGIANPGDYVLVRIKDGEEKLCPEGELVSRFLEDSTTALAYKRMDAKIGWPLKIN